jgi:hypothetical protein
MIYSQEGSEIIFTESVANEIDAISSKFGKKLFLLADSNTITHCFPIIKRVLPENIPVFIWKQERKISILRAWLKSGIF